MANMGFSRANPVKAFYFLQQQTDRLHSLGKSSRCSSCPKLSKAADRAMKAGVTLCAHVLMLPFWTFLRLLIDVHAKLDGKIKLTKLVVLWPALSQTLLHSVLGTVYSGFALIIQNDGIGSVLLGHTAKPGRAAKGVQRLTIKSAEINYGSSFGEKNINMEKCII